MSTPAAAVLVQAEERLRAHGLTGAQAFDALVNALRAKLGDEVKVRPVAAAAVESIDPKENVDLLGLAYERFFADLFKGKRGQYFTPRPLVELLLDLAGVRKGMTLLDPTCGSGGFVVCAARRGAKVRGIELDPALARLAELNLRLAGHPGQIDRGDFFATRPRPVDVVVANPPFSVPIRDPKVLDRYELAADRDRVLSDWLFVEALERWVKPGGRAAIVMPWSVLVNPTSAPLRERLADHWHTESIVALPEGVFRPFGGAAGRACLLVLLRGGSGFTRWAEVTDPGWDPRSVHLKATPGADLAELRAGRGWRWLAPGQWTPSEAGITGRELVDLASVATEVVHPGRDMSGQVALADLADGDRSTGELQPRLVDADKVRGGRIRLHPGQVLVARMRPELGNVVVAGETDRPLVGSPEWIPLSVEGPANWVLHALRTPTWRGSLPITHGQTRPRTSADAVLQTTIPWPGDALADRVHQLSSRIHHQRAGLRSQLDAVQLAVDRFAAGELDAASLAAELDRIERGEPG